MCLNLIQVHRGVLELPQSATTRKKFRQKFLHNCNIILRQLHTQTFLQLHYIAKYFQDFFFSKLRILERDEQPKENMKTLKMLSNIQKVLKSMYDRLSC